MVTADHVRLNISSVEVLLQMLLNADTLVGEKERGSKASGFHFNIDKLLLKICRFMWAVIFYFLK